MNLPVPQFLLFILILIMHLCVWGGYVYVSSTGACRGQKVSDPLKLELQVAVSCLV